MALTNDNWNSSDPYEYFMGRWSNRMAPLFLDWLAFPKNKSWLDLGCGTGALSEAILLKSEPSHLACTDPSEAFLSQAALRLKAAVELKQGSATSIPFAEHHFDIVVSGLALNFFSNVDEALQEIKRVLKPGGTIAAYVWDYAGKMEFLRLFWDAAIEADPTSRSLDEGIRFPICNATVLEKTFLQAGLAKVSTTALDINTVFNDFDDYWLPFLGAQGPAPGYLTSLKQEQQDKLKYILLKKLTAAKNGQIKLLARAIAVRGIFKN